MGLGERNGSPPDARRASSRSEFHSSLPRLVAARRAAALLVLLAAYFVFIAPAVAQTVQIWSATLNPKDIGGGTVFGCSSRSSSGRKCSESSVLSDNDVDLEGDGNRIDLLSVEDGLLSIQLRPDVAGSVDHLTLHVGDISLSFASAAAQPFGIFTWNSTGLSWSAGDPVQLRITAPASRAPIRPSLSRSTRLGPDGVARASVTLSWGAPTQGSFSGLQFRLGRYPEDRNGASPAPFACTGNRAFSDSRRAWRDLPDSGPNGVRSFTFDARWLGCVGQSLDEFEFRAQLRAVQRVWPNPWSTSEPSAEARMPNTVPRLLGMGLGSGDVSALEAGDDLVIRAIFDRPVRVTTSGGEPSIGLTIGGTARRAVFRRVVNPPRFRNYGRNVGSAIEFAYTMQASDAEASAITVTRNSLRATGGASIVSATGGSRPALSHSQFVLREDRWNAQATSGEPLTATLESVPSSHDGERAFSVRVRFSEAIATGYEAVRDHALTVTNAEVTNASRVDGRSDLWKLDIEPGSDTDATLSVAANRECTESGALCTADGRSLSNALEATIAGPVETTAEEQVATTGLTASFQNVPASHAGSGAISLRIGLDAALSTSWKGVRHSLAIANGALTRIHRIDGRSDLWGIEVEPAGDGDVTVRLNPSADCADPATTMCSAGGRRLETAVSTVIPGPTPVDPSALLTASFENMPSEHNADSFTFRIWFSEPIRIGWKTMRDSSVRVTQDGRTGGAAGARRVDGRNDLWEITVDPASGADIEIGLGPTAACTETGAMCTNGGKAQSSSLQASVIGPPGLSVADATVTEAAGATVEFRVSMSRASSSAVTVDYATSDGSSPNGATAGADYTAATGTLTFAPGALTKTVSVAVLDDSHDEGEETLTLSLSNVSGNNAWLKDATATGTIENTDHMPKAWLARFGRTVAGHVLDGVSERMKAPRAAGLSAALGGQALPGMNLSGDPAARPAEADTAETEARARALSDWLNGGTGDNGDAARGIGSRTVTGRELVLGSTFSLTGETSDGGTAGFWGRAAVSGFDGREGDLSLDGEVITGLLGADYGPGRWLMGLIASHSRGEGSYRGSSAGAVSSTLTGLHPWARYAVSERLSVWGAAGYGAGTLTLEPEGGTPMKADLSLALAAAGGRGELLEAPGDAGGRALALVGDAMFVRTESERTTGLAAASADVTRLRLALDGSWRFVLEGGPSLTPSLELGVRHDGGDAETGFGVDIGGGLAFADPKRGLIFDVSARTLAAHEAPGFRELGITAALSFDPLPSTDRGLTMSLRQTLGAASAGGADALMRRETLAGLGANDDSDARRLELTAGYGIAMFDGRFTGTPELGVGLSDAGRDYRLGWRLGPGSGGGTSFELGLEAERRERANDDEAEHKAGFRIRAAW